MKKQLPKARAHARARALSRATARVRAKQRLGHENCPNRQGSEKIFKCCINEEAVAKNMLVEATAVALKIPPLEGL